MEVARTRSGGAIIKQEVGKPPVLYRNCGSKGGVEFTAGPSLNQWSSGFAV